MIKQFNIKSWWILLLLLTTVGVGQTYGQTGKEILEKHFSASGQDLWNQVNDVSIEGRWVDEDYHAYSINLSAKRPGRLRIEGRYNGREFIEATNGQLAWILAPWKQVYDIQRMSLQEQLMIENSFSLGSPIYPLRDTVQFKGLVDVEGMVYLSYVYEQLYGDQMVKRTFYLDRDDHHLYLETYEWANVSFQKIYEKYRDYSGLVVPTAVRFQGDDFEKELVYDKVFIGIGLKNQIFEVPKGQ